METIFRSDLIDCRSGHKIKIKIKVLLLKEIANKTLLDPSEKSFPKRKKESDEGLFCSMITTTIFPHESNKYQEIIKILCIKIPIGPKFLNLL